MENFQTNLLSLMKDNIEQLTIEFNPQSIHYIKVEDYIKEFKIPEWISTESKLESINKNVLWSIFTVDTNESDSISINASNLKDIIQYANKKQFSAEENLQIENVEERLKAFIQGRFGNLMLSIRNTQYSHEKEYSDDYEWVSKESKETALKTNTLIWTMDVFPNTPIGSYSVAGVSLLDCVKKIEDLLKITVLSKSIIGDLKENLKIK